MGYYFVAAQGTNVLYLDPHTVQPTLDNRRASSDFPTESHHSRAIRSMRLEHVDPSLTLAFLVHSAADFAELCAALPAVTNGMICNVTDRAPSIDEAMLSQLAMGDDDDASGDDW